MTIQERENSQTEQEHYRRLPELAVLIPCYNEETTVEKVVWDFKAALPEATIYVYDNNSKDATAARARSAGAIVQTEPMQGKGNVVRRMFADIEADIYVLVDGDDTYDSGMAPELVNKLVSGPFDMVTGVRDIEHAPNYQRSHRYGTNLLAFMVAKVFDSDTSDMFSGYRAFSRRFVKSFPAITSGFEIETELTIHAFELHMRSAEIKSLYRDRPAGSTSKLRTYRDGLHVLRTILLFIKEERPLQLFTAFFACLVATSIILGSPILRTYLDTGLVPRFPTAILASAIMLLAFLSLTVGIILSSVTRARHEMKRLFYLNLPPPVRFVFTPNPDLREKIASKR